MYLTAHNLPIYLAYSGLISFDSIVNEQMTVVEVNRRNRNFKVVREHAPGFFVKQVAAFDAVSIDTLRRDGRCYWLANNHAEFVSLAPMLPAFHKFDVARSILVIALEERAESLHQLHLRTGTFPVDVAEALAVCLARVHMSFRSLPASSASSAFPGTHPWALTLGDSASFPVSLQSPAGHVLLQIATGMGLDRAMAARRATWQVETLIHGDIKWDNCLRLNSNVDGEIRLVDWEIADVGDPAWDIGSAFQSYLAHWLFSRSTSSPPAPNFDHGFTLMQPAMRGFWDTYVRVSETKEAQALLDRSISFAAARLIQTAYESLHAANGVTPHSLSFLQLASQLLNEAEEAHRTILGN